jgi:hypothetical protein
VGSVWASREHLCCVIVGMVLSVALLPLVTAVLAYAALWVAVVEPTAPGLK